ncbi:MAG TPA: FtsQ-type POTRA domain-containing protein [Thermoanaerobaculia bacterium]|nr:FtsQ-type POTRA domain-containing protein [Thermoanaerobaculia bacterium]
MTGTLAGTPMGPVGTPGAGGRVLDFKRRSAPPRRRRPSFLRSLLRPLTMALALVALPLGAGVWVLTSGRFDLRQVIVEGGEGQGQRVSAAWIERALAPYQGKNLVLMPLSELVERLHRNPWIDTVEVEKELPDGLRVAFTERRPVALLLRQGALAYADAEGRPIAPITSPQEADKARRDGLLMVSFSHPLLRSGGVSRAIAVAGELGRVEPDWAAHLSRIEVLGEEDFRLYTGALPFPLLVRSGEVSDKAARLGKLLPELMTRYPEIEAVDLRFSRRIVVQPAASPQSGNGVGPQAIF